MDLHQIRYALAVADHGGFTAAAEHLYVTQPSLSQGVAALERDLGARLFDRVGRRVRLTAAGEAFLAPARDMLRVADNVRTAVGEVAGLTAGHLDLLSLPTLAVEPAARFVGAFRTRFPDITVRLVEPEDDREARSLLATGECELGLVVLPVRESRIVTEPLFDQEVLAVLPPGSRPRTRRGALPVETLAEMPLITTPVGTSSRRLLDRALATVEATPRIAVETDQREAILPLVLEGAGAALLAAPLAAGAVDRGAVVFRTSPKVTRTVALAHRRGPRSPAAEAFMEIARQAPVTRSVRVRAEGAAPPH
jgi:DNA-binding transcriptional LysR family regulator